MRVILFTGKGGVGKTTVGRRHGGPLRRGPASARS
jgi:septum formation inhibitor-activating ATPase MinD